MTFRRFRLRSLGKRRDSGHVAIEFALIAPIFFLLFFGTMEVGLSIFASQLLENGVKMTSRLVRTGQAQTLNMTATQFRAVLCGQVSILLSCDPAKLYIDVRSFENFASSTFPAPLDSDGNLNAGLNSFDMGSSSQSGGSNTIVLVRAFYTWQLFTPLFGQFYANMPDNTRLLSASAAFKNEPF